MGGTMSLVDETDKLIINHIQSDFPIDSNPFAVIGQNIGLSEVEVISRVQKLKDNGIIRRIGGNFSPEKLGFFSTLCSAKVPVDKIESFSKFVNKYPGVTHNYIREHEYNVWFTFIAPSFETIENNLKTIAESTGIDTINNLPATKVFKISAKFKL